MKNARGRMEREIHKEREEERRGREINRSRQDAQRLQHEVESVVVLSSGLLQEHEQEFQIQQERDEEERKENEASQTDTTSLLVCRRWDQRPSSACSLRVSSFLSLGEGDVG